ncbi:MAG: hypothetical protein A3G17_03245 [Planctomycetes bacterium RIFCSPLOWO2_12_FULL_50_35]|nr:MAG: hypothetical protein A3G17_03245 [Planctomycetes bacterium RIFCSPLOWO2_12_FULL_50_35]
MEKVVMPCIVSIFLYLFPLNLYAIQPELSDKEAQEAVNYGEKNSRTIFKTLEILPACLAAWPSMESGLVRSKYINLAVTAAKKKRHREKLAEAEIKDAMTSNTLEVLIQTREDVTIKLIQHDKVIEPVSIAYLDHHCEWCDFYGDKASKENHEYVIASFPYSEINPKLITTVIFWNGGSERQYEVNLSQFK